MRTVLSVDPLGGVDPQTDAERLTVRIVRSPFEIDKGNVARPLPLSPDELPAWNTPDAVLQRGRKVRDSLRKHPGVDTLLTQLAATPPGQTQPLYVMLSDSDAELISWETLCDLHDAFVALDRRWPIGRIIDPMSGVSRPPARFEKPVRMLAVISALGVKGQVKEWQMVRDAVLGARKAGLEVRLRVLVGDAALRQQIDAELPNLPGFEAGAIDGLAQDLLAGIVDWAPNLLHLFCHGRSEAGAQFIELATATAYLDPEAEDGIVKLTPKQLVDISGQLRNPWLLTLNCCASGKAAKNLQSIAHRVVGAGMPAAIAMLEPVDAADAHVFSRAFYRSLFAALKRVADTLQAAPRASMEWSEAMVDARNALCDVHGGAPDHGAWTFPVLYVRGLDPFQFEQPQAAGADDMATEYRGRALVIAGWLKTAGAGKSEAERQEVMNLTLFDVPKSFWPTPGGEFANG